MVPCVANGRSGAVISSDVETFERHWLFAPFLIVGMYYVYLLRSEADPTQTYIGYSEDLRQRLRIHNSGGSPHTAKYRPWRVAGYHAFVEKTKAVMFERYLKSHSGKAFARKRLW